AYRFGIAGAGVIHRPFLLQEPPGGDVFAQIVAQAEILALERQIEIWLAERQEINREGARFTGAAHPAERERHDPPRGPRGVAKLVEKRLQIERRIPQSDDRFAVDAAGVAKKAIVRQTREADWRLTAAQAHGELVVLKGRGSEPVMISERGVVINRFFLERR